MKNYHSGARFEDTNWEFIESLEKDSLKDLSAETYNDFVFSYKDPLYSFLRYSGYSQQDSEDLTQEFFLKVFDTNLLVEVSKEKGKLRSYLIGSLKRMIARKKRHENAIKRGGGIEHKVVSEDSEFLLDAQTPAHIYDQVWAESIISRAKDKLFADQTQLNETQKKILTELLNWNAEGVSYKDAAGVLAISVPALKSKVFRLRASFRELLYKEVAATLINPTIVDIEQELESLRKCWDGYKN